MISSIIAEYIGLLVLLIVSFIFIFPRLLKDDEIARFIKAFIVFIIVIVFNLIFTSNKDGFHFELTPQKYCEGGDYMRSSSPEKQKFCSQFSEVDMSRYECPSGFVGAPVNWNYTPESDDKWQNTRCKDISSSYNDPQVL